VLCIIYGRSLQLAAENLPNVRKYIIVVRSLTPRKLRGMRSLCIFADKVKDEAWSAPYHTLKQSSVPSETVSISLRNDDTRHYKQEIDAIMLKSFLSLQEDNCDTIKLNVQNPP
jgi:hypothetical protein